MDRTVKSDWLNDLLASKNGMFVSGHESFTRRLGIIVPANCAIRFVSYQRQYMWLLTIEADRKHWDSIRHSVLQSENYVMLNRKFEKNLQINIFSGNKSDGFMFNSNLVNDQEMCEIYEKILPKSTSNAGTQKEVNRTVADNLHEWHRQYVSKYCVANDFDAIQFKSDGQHILYELKRVKEDIRSWMPYVDDYSNYDRMLRICTMLNFQPYAIAYNVEQSDCIAFHYGLQPSKEYIAGTSAIANLQIGDYEKETIREYLSTNRRRIS